MRNYQKELDNLIEQLEIQSIKPKLLLHSCCAPCSSYVLEYLTRYFLVTIYYFNPNIYPDKEYFRRVEEQKILIKEMSLENPVEFIEEAYETDKFYKAVEDLEYEPEGGERCFCCYRLRLEKAAIKAADDNYDYFTTTLSISPHKNAQKLNQIGEELAEKYNVKYLPSDFKKKNGFKRSIELSKEYKLYRQDYCGCIFSKNKIKNAGSS